MSLSEQYQYATIYTAYVAPDRTLTSPLFPPSTYPNTVWNALPGNGLHKHSTWQL